MGLEYFPDKGLARYSDDGIPFYVSTLVQNTGKRMPGITAYTFARLSRSPDPLCDILGQVMKPGIDPLERLNQIFHGYGHSSVGDMANLAVFFHRIPVYYSIRIFNILYVLGGQERSTRYQDFSTPDFCGLPESVKTSSPRLSDEFDKIVLSQYKSYRDLVGPTQEALAEYFDIPIDHLQLKRRAFDTVRYVLPLAHSTSVGVVMSARQWSYLISVFKSSPDVIEQSIAELLINLLGDYPNDVGYKPEAGALIRHTEPAKSGLGGMKAIVGKHTFSCPDAQEMRLSSYTSPEDALVKSIARLSHPRQDALLIFSAEDYHRLGEAMFSVHNQYNPLGNVAQTGDYLLEFYTDMGVMKDLNRHRSAERFMPILTPEINMREEVCGEFDLCPYLTLDSPKIRALRLRYSERIEEVYEDIYAWMSLAKSPEIQGYAKMLLPYAHRSYMRMGLSVDDLQYLINLRIRPGGHIAYRLVMQEVLDLAVKRNSLWKVLSDRLPRVDVSDKDQFMNS